jgi:hypothetical protein
MNEFDNAVQEFVREVSDEKEIVTGWVLCATVKHPAIPNSDGYVVRHSEGLAYHSQIGLLQASLDEKRNVILAQVIQEG